MQIFLVSSFLSSAGISSVFLSLPCRTTGFANVGLSGYYGTSWFLPRLVGDAKARELFFTGERVDAQRCLALGIVNRVVPDAALRDETLALARQLADGPSAAYRLMKQAFDASIENDFEAQTALEAKLQGEAGRTRDFKEGVMAFLEKRKPVYEGR